MRCLFILPKRGISDAAQDLLYCLAQFQYYPIIKGAGYIIAAIYISIRRFNHCCWGTALFVLI